MVEKPKDMHNYINYKWLKSVCEKLEIIRLRGKQGAAICFLQRKHFNNKDAARLEVKRWKEGRVCKY